MTNEEPANRIDRLMDAIDLLHADDRAGAVAILRQLIREDNDFEDAWLWMSVAVDSLDQSSLCLDNVLRVNPANIAAATALHRIRTPEMAVEKRRGRLRLARDVAFALMWMLVLGILYALLITYFNVGG